MVYEDYYLQQLFREVEDIDSFIRETLSPVTDNPDWQDYSEGRNEGQIEDAILDAESIASDEPQSSRGEFQYKHASGLARLYLLVPQVDGDRLAAGVITPEWEELGLEDGHPKKGHRALQEFHRPIVEGNSTEYIEPIPDGITAAKISIPADYDEQEMEETWEAINTMAWELNSFYDDPVGTVAKYTDTIPDLHIVLNDVRD